MENMVCRIGCGACCIAPSLSSAIPGMPDGKPAGVPCVQLTKDRRCKVYDKPERPAVCASYQAREEFCGTNEGEAMRLLEELELMTGAAGGNEGRNPIHG
jgi:Fe-S-cluster containining protein